MRLIGGSVFVGAAVVVIVHLFIPLNASIKRSDFGFWIADFGLTFKPKIQNPQPKSPSRERMGIEPTRGLLSKPHDGFEDRGRHQAC